MSVGERIGPYALRERLEGGADTELWRAERDDGRQRGPSTVAMRLARRAEAASALRRREYAALRAVEDKRFPRVVAYFAGQGALATTWVEGADLREVIDAASEGLIPLELATAVDIALEVAQGIRAAHLAPDGPWVHGHLDPTQVLLTEDGSVVILGLGHEPEAPKRDYLPPEQLAHRAADARSDQWAIAALLYEMTTFSSLAEAQSRQQGQSLGALAVQQPAVARVLRTALAQEPSLRFGSDGDFVRALHGLAREIGGSSARARVVQRLRYPEQDIQLPPAPRPPEEAPSLPPRPTPSLDRATPSLSRPTPSLDRAAPSLSRPTPSLDRAAPSLSRPTPSVERREVTIGRPSQDREATRADRPVVTIGRPSVDRAAPSRVERIPIGLGPPQREPRPPTRLEAITEDFEVFGVEASEDEPSPRPAPLSLARGAGVSLPPKSRSSVDVPVDPGRGLVRPGPTLSPEETPARGSTLRLTTLSAPSVDEAIEDEDTDDQLPSARPLMVSASFDDALEAASVEDDLGFDAMVFDEGFDEAPVLETPSQNALAPPVEEEWLDEDKRPTAGDEPVGPPMMDLPPSMHADPLPDDIPTTGDPEPLTATFNPAERVALVALALFTMTAVYVALRNFT